MVDAATTEHRDLAFGLRVAVHLEEVDLGLGTDVHEGECAVAVHVLGPRHLGIEDLPVEPDEPVRVTREDGHVVEAVQEHVVVLLRLMYPSIDGPVPQRGTGSGRNTTLIAPDRLRSMAVSMASR